MRNFTVVFNSDGTLDVISARAFLGVGRAADLDEELEQVRNRLSALPESGNPTKTRRGGWSFHVRRVVLSSVRFTLYYRLDLEAELVVISALRHQRQRQPRF